MDRLKIPTENQATAENLTPIATRTVTLSRDKKESGNKARGDKTENLKTTKIDDPATIKSPIIKIETIQAKTVEIKAEAAKAVENAEEMSLPMSVMR
jgi:hypothetical protein